MCNFLDKNDINSAVEKKINDMKLSKTHAQAHNFQTVGERLINDYEAEALCICVAAIVIRP